MNKLVCLHSMDRKDTPRPRNLGTKRLSDRLGEAKERL